MISVWTLNIFLRNTVKNIYNWSLVQTEVLYVLTCRCYKTCKLDMWYDCIISCKTPQQAISACHNINQYPNGILTKWKCHINIINKINKFILQTGEQVNYECKSEDECCGQNLAMILSPLDFKTRLGQLIKLYHFKSYRGCKCKISWTMKGADQDLNWSQRQRKMPLEGYVLNRFQEF